MEFNRPTNIIPTPWAENGQYENIPATQVSSGRASWDAGFPLENTIPVSSGGIPANYNDFQGVLHDLSEHTCFQQTGGMYLWSSSIDYPVGALVQGSDDKIYRALQKNGPNTTVANPVTDSSGKWTSFVLTTGNQAIKGGLTVTSGVTVSGGMTVSGTISGTTTNASSLGGVAASGYVNTTSAQTVGGAKTYTGSAVFSSGATFSDTIRSTKDVTMTRNIDTDAFRIYGGSSNEDKGASISLYGKDHASQPGRFRIAANNGSGDVSLVGTPAGMLSWNGSLNVTSGATISGGITGVCTSATSAGNASSLGGVAASGYVDTSGSQVISGGKEFTSDLVKKNTALTRGVAPSSAVIDMYKFTDKNAAMLGAVQCLSNTDGSRDMRIRAVDGDGSVHDVNYNYGKWSYPSFYPGGDNGVNLGFTGYRWKQLYAATTTISTSDERQKTSISVVPDAVLDAWGEVAWSQFQFKDAVVEKGENARLHNGLIAQRIDEAFKAYELDASRYGLFCWDSWEATPEERDEKGNVTQEARPAGDAYSLRYEEALAMEAAYQRRRADRAEARITALEERLGEMEAVLASLIAPIGDEQTEAQEGEGADA